MVIKMISTVIMLVASPVAGFHTSPLSLFLCVQISMTVIIQEVDNGHFDALISGCAFVLPVHGGERCTTGRTSLAVPYPR